MCTQWSSVVSLRKSGALMTQGLPPYQLAAVSTRSRALHFAESDLLLFSPNPESFSGDYAVALFCFSPAPFIYLWWYLGPCKIIMVLSIKKYIICSLQQSFSMENRWYLERRERAVTLSCYVTCLRWQSWLAAESRRGTRSLQLSPARLLLVVVMARGL